ncbi:hypothetical protein OE88DRAFT_568093 [Heliocybe sulcata]|uniref:Uncharacterized protein n=1 Tax=Heliocybe sulcata TaxID=5364 RepID=A0A5C3MVS9_9AGAM|nr:hypothetical protein OE88DRAFT_568093 [Heliocybe sulcata]
MYASPSTSSRPASSASYRYPPRHTPQYPPPPPRRVHSRSAPTPAAEVIYHTPSRYHHQPRHRPPPISVKAAEDYPFDDEPLMIYSTPNHPLAMSSPSSSSCTPPSPPPPRLPSLAAGYTSVSPPSHDHRGRLQSYVENPAQRRERVEFIKRRENLRRVRAWVHDLSESGLAEVEHVEDVRGKVRLTSRSRGLKLTCTQPQKHVDAPICTRSPAQSQVIYHTSPSPSPSPSWLDPSEPHIFYLTSGHPSPPSSSSSWSPSSSPPTSVGSLSPERGGKRFGKHSRQSSLESISEEGE